MFLCFIISIIFYPFKVLVIIVVFCVFTCTQQQLHKYDDVVPAVAFCLECPQPSTFIMLNLALEHATQNIDLSTIITLHTTDPLVSVGDICIQNQFWNQTW